jgi:hypothetical protein
VQRFILSSFVRLAARRVEARLSERSHEQSGLLKATVRPVTNEKRDECHHQDGGPYDQADPNFGIRQSRGLFLLVFLRLMLVFFGISDSTGPLVVTWLASDWPLPKPITSGRYEDVIHPAR